MYLLAFAETIQLFPDGTIFIHIALILFMMWVLNRTLFKPINRVLAAREKTKGGRSSEAAAIIADVESKEAKYARELREARSKGYELIEVEHRQAATERTEKLAAARSEVQQQIDKGKQDVDRQVSEARKAIDQNAEQLADRIAASILRG
jgi:F-type H+-transporting ATPase subunit b